MPKLRVHFNGVAIPSGELGTSGDSFQVAASYQIATVRGAGASQALDLDDTRLVQLTTLDDIEWIGYADDLPEVYGLPLGPHRSGETPQFSLPDQLTSQRASQRGFGLAIGLERLDLIMGTAVERTARNLGEWVDGKVMKTPGLKWISRDFQVQPATSIQADTHYLLLLHGTISSTLGSFDKLPLDKWQAIHDHFQARTIAFDHYTIQDSPFKNVVDLLRSLPDELTLTLLSASRGGLVADVLSRCDHRNAVVGFQDAEIDLIAAESPEQAEEMRLINTLARSKRLTVEKVVRSACPAAGTLLLSKRMDHFLNALLNVIGKAFGGRANVIYGAVKDFLLAVLKERHEADAFPGLWAMVPESPYQQVNNNSAFEVKAALYAVAGDAEIGGGLWNSLKVILTNLYYWEANDFVVHTRSMTQGLLNRSHAYSLRVEDSGIHHFAYFHFHRTHQPITAALTASQETVAGFDPIPDGSGERGVALRMVDLGSFASDHATGHRPIILLLPGIMGSHISHEGNRIWLDFAQIHQGGIGQYLRHDATGLSSDSVVAKYYKPFKDRLQDRYDIVVHPYDWRRSVEDLADGLEQRVKDLLLLGQPVYLVTHSMGGLVARAWKEKYPESWLAYRQSMDSKWIMLGTPWLGSYLIMEVLTGHSSRVRQLNLLDFQHSRKELLGIFHRYRGVFDLLPVDHVPLEENVFWQEIQSLVGKKRMPEIPAEMLQYFKQRKKHISTHQDITGEDQNHIYYIAGSSPETVNGYQVRDSFFRGRHLHYTTTDEGDGSVTWASGIPRGLKSAHLYYSHAGHGDMAISTEILAALPDLLEQGQTDRLSTTPLTASHRGEVQPDTRRRMDELSYHDPEIIGRNLFGVQISEDRPSDEAPPLRIEVFNGDLKWSRYPLMIGHFKNDGIVSAERTLDGYLDGKLFERKQLGFYPGEIGEQAILHDQSDTPPGAVIVGLGNKDKLTGYLLAKSVEKAVLRYALFWRDGRDGSQRSEARQGLSTLLVGSAYGKLSRTESIRNIILGIQRANITITRIGSGLLPIQTLEFVDYYEDNAYECYKILGQLRGDNSLVFDLKKNIEKGFGHRRRLLRRESRSWWQSMTVQMLEDQTSPGSRYLSYTANSGLATVSVERVHANLKLAQHLAEELCTKPEIDPDDAKTIFELLIPNDYKDFIRNHRNIELKMDVESAAFPWEMFYDSQYGKKPAFVEAGLIRQLYQADVPIEPVLVNNDRALVIGDPQYHDPETFPPLSGAVHEAQTVTQSLRSRGVEVEKLIRSEALAINRALYAREYKILHIAGHGVYDPEAGRVGIVIGKDLFLDPGTIEQLSAIPEFVFINCCHSGEMDPTRETYLANRHRLAANIGTQFIRKGVKAVVIAGWAVHDQAASLFARQLYNYLEDGYYFGEAIRLARRDCYDRFPKTNTWGAYQCYGDQFYRLHRGGTAKREQEELTLESELAIALGNILSESRAVDLDMGRQRVITGLREQTQKLVDQARLIGKYTVKIIEAEAMIYVQLGLYELAIDRLERLIQEESGGFQIQVLELYTNIRAKKLAKDLLLEDPGASRQPYVKQLAQILKDIHRQQALGETYDRMNTFGSTYKRAALIEPDDSQSRKYLDQAATYYRKAWQQAGSDLEKVYPATSYFTLLYLRYRGISRYINGRAERDQLGSPGGFLQEWTSKVDQYRLSRSDGWGQLARIQIRLCALVFGQLPDEASVQQLKDDYTFQVRRCINVKDLVGEIEHMRFLAAMLERIGKSAHSEAVQQLRQHLEKWL